MQIPDDVLAWAIDETRAWIQQQRELHRPAGGELPSVAKDAVHPFFPPAVLDSSRGTVLSAIPNLPFLAQARDLALAVDGMESLTLVDTILISQAVPPTDPLRLMFHELVHAVQYEILGAGELPHQYVHGIVDGEFDSHRIPLEVMFADDPGAAFSVLAEVRRRLGRV